MNFVERRKINEALQVFISLTHLSLFGCASLDSSGLDQTVLPYSSQMSIYFDAKEIVDLDLTADGRRAIFVTKQRSVTSNKAIYQTQILDVETGETSKPIPLLNGVEKISWRPPLYKELIFKKQQKGVSNLLKYAIDSKSVAKIDTGNESVHQFQVAPVSGKIAWVNSEPVHTNRPNSYERIMQGDRGVVLDTKTLSVYHFLNPDWDNIVSSPGTRLFIKNTESTTLEIVLPGVVTDFRWSLDGKFLSVIVADAESNLKNTENKASNIFIVDSVTGAQEPLEHPSFMILTDRQAKFTRAEWLRGHDLIYVQREISGIETAGAEFAIIEIDGFSVISNRYGWQAKERDYFADNDYDDVLLFDTRVVANRTLGARVNLYDQFTDERTFQDSLIDGAGSIRNFKLNQERNLAVFVCGDIQQLSEICILDIEKQEFRKSQINYQQQQKLEFSWKAVRWDGDDNTKLHGWLLTAGNVEDTRSNQPLPMLTFIHGGPTLAIRDVFADYFNTWSYPFELLAASGIAVFIPHYSGSPTFGEDYRTPSDPADEPITDVLLGINHLIDQGIADNARLAVAGHSNGSWLGALIMASEKDFVAASFAEGSSNQFLTYSLMSERLNEHYHDKIYSGSMYELPTRYIAQSPTFHFSNVDTAVLFEAGSKSLPINMMEFPKAANRFGLPAEFVTYPKTAHNPDLPRIQLDIASRNLDWFRFWLQGYVDPDPRKGDQYVRWRKMREERCAWDEPEDEHPSYCEFAVAN